MGFGFGSQKRRIEERRRTRREEKRLKKLRKSQAPAPGEAPLERATPETVAPLTDSLESKTPLTNDVQN